MFKSRKNRENNIEGGRERGRKRKFGIHITINYVVISWKRGLLRWEVIKFDGEPRVSIVQSELLTLNSQFIGWILFHLRFVESAHTIFLEILHFIAIFRLLLDFVYILCTNNLSLLIFLQDLAELFHSFLHSWTFHFRNVLIIFNPFLIFEQTFDMLIMFL